jgi:hypothetical protein
VNRALGVLAVLVAIVLVIVWVAPGIVTRIAADRIRHEAGSRDLAVDWERLHAGWDGGIVFRRLTVSSRLSGDTLLIADSLAVRLSRLALLGLHAKVVRIGAARAAFRLPHRGSDDVDTLPLVTEHRRRREDPERAARWRRSAESVVRLLFTPTRELPALTLHDVTIQAPSGAEGFWSGLWLAWLESHPEGGGMRAAAVGTIRGENDLPFEASLSHGADDRIRGGLEVAFPGSDGTGPEKVLLVLDGALRQDRRHGVVMVHDTTHLTLGKIALRVGAEVNRQGPAVRLRLEASNVTQQQVRASLPAAVLGPLLDVSIEGSWDYRLGLDLDLARPDSVQFTADVIPHGLAIDPERTRLRLLGLDEPFVATIHLPRGRLVTRELSPANPFYRPLTAISPALVSAVVTNEDGGFFHHRGFNTGAVRDAIAENLKAGAFLRGAGTITMQLARNLYLGHDRTLSRKFREVVLAWILEHLTGLSKERLLEIYLNIIEWGPDVHGAGEAARYYFDRDPADLSVSEALFLTTIVPSPLRWRSRVDATGALRPWEKAQMHFIGRAMIAKGWLPSDALPPSDSLQIELRGLARASLFPADSPSPADSVAVPSGRPPGF